MARFLRSIVSPFQTLTASAEITPVDLPVNPLSLLLLTLQGTQVAQTTTVLYSAIFDFLNTISAVSVRHRGENIIQGDLIDLYMMQRHAFGMHLMGVKFDSDLAKVRSVTIPLLFGRKPYWPDEAFPATTRGNLQFFMTSRALQASFSAVSWQLEAVELVEASPKAHLKYMTNSRAITADGQNDYPLPIGNPLLGVLLFDPEAIATDGALYTLGQVKLLVDNVEQYYPNSDWESLVGDGGLRGVNHLTTLGHRHDSNFNATYLANEATSEQELDSDESPARWAFLDFDPLKDGSYMLETAGHADVKIRASRDVGAANGTVRYLPLELVSVGGGA